MPPPIRRISSSSSTIFGLPKVPSDILLSPIQLVDLLFAADQFFRFAGTVAAHHALGEHAVSDEFGHFGHRLVAVGIDRAFRGGADREFEALDVAVAELDGPHDGVGAAQRLHRAAQRHNVGIVARFDGVLRADLDAGITFPALLRFLVPRLHRGAGFGAVLVQFHQVMRADIHAGSLILPLAAIAFFGTYKCWHSSYSSSKNKVSNTSPTTRLFPLAGGMSGWGKHLNGGKAELLPTPYPSPCKGE